MEELAKVYNDYNYTFQKKLNPKEKIICKIPRPDGNAHSVKSISWSVQPDVEIKGTLSYQTDSSYTIWENFQEGAQVSPAVTAISMENKSTFIRSVFLWVIME